MNVYLKPFRCAMEELWVSGLSWKHPDTQEQHTTKVIAPVLCADAPARAIVLCTKNYNSRLGCNCCEQKSKKIDLTPEEIEFNTNNTDRRKMKRRKRRLLFEEVPAVLRTGPRMDLLGQMAQARGKSRKGVLGVAEVSVIPHFDRAASVSAEYLHLILLGVCKYFLNLIFFKPGPCYSGAKLDEIEDFIADIKVPDYVKRLPRKINDMKFWKASEFRAFLLFYSLPIFKQHWKQQYLEHWLLLVQATYILLQDCITEDDLNAAEIMIQSFVRDICGLYNYAFYTYNVHTLLHLPLLVRRWGLLWATSAFVFESYNAYIADHVHGTKHIGKELINNIKTAQSVATLDNIVNAPTLNYLHQQIANVMLGKSLAIDSISDEEKRTLNSCATLGTYVLHSRAKLGDHTGMFTTRVYDKNKKRANSFIQFKEEDGNNAYGPMLYFIKAEDTSFHCLVNGLKINHVNLIFHAPSRYIVKHLVPFEGTYLLRVIPVECILQKTLKIGSYLAIPPNSFEINL